MLARSIRVPPGSVWGVRMVRAAGQPSFVPHGEDRFGEHHNMGAGILTFRVTTAESHGALVIVELAHHCDFQR